MPRSPRISLAEVSRSSGGLLRRGDTAHDDPAHPPTLGDLTESLFFSPGDGRIWLQDQRMVLLHGAAFGHLRRELIDTLGADKARGLLTRAGYLSGTRDAQLVRGRWPDGDLLSVFLAGTRLHALEGVVKVTPLAVAFDKLRGTYEGEFRWDHSVEADEHLAAYGVGTECACWNQIGYAIGYVTTLFGQLVVFREVECRAAGAPACRVVGRHAAAWGDVREDLHHLHAQGFHSPAPRARAPAPHAASTQEGATAATQAPTGLVGASSAFHSACHQLARVARTQATVLFTGESGVGKEAFARQLHATGPRAQAPFVAVNCAAIPETLLESELFGVERGAFTGATRSRPGRFERADRGTLFLDEIATLSLTSQGKLLRALQEGEVERVGGTRTLRVDVRVVAATNVDLQQEVRAGRFREDLYYRLNVYPIHLPPLRDRRDDVPLLMDHFLQVESRRHARTPKGFSQRAMRAMMHYAFPGNIRELQNLIERGVISCDDGEAIDLPHMFRREQLPDDLLLSVGSDGNLQPESAPGRSLREAVADALEGGPGSLHRIEQRLLRETLQAHGGNVAAAARDLGLTRAQFAYRLRRGEQAPEPRRRGRKADAAS
ncbi:sigma-54-dependent Fis family transcriptional regulator [Thiomonas sp. FB-6]|uniref:sigma-54-dependent Fis family transcriptional regulator n=1 Tax=Thiomonas sp. FB-6 TaxID=1158291 RepID=UPI00037DEA15|nr:sigma-54-dependent Fis family transcriptional regulator [Thiomonas sp. FB-6]